MRKTLKVINRLKKDGIIRDYAIGGAVAALKWVEPFFTRDLDIFIIPVQEQDEKKVISFSPIYEALKERGYHQWTGQWLMIEGIPVEFLPAEGLAKEAVNEAIETEFEGILTKVVRPEFLIALFLDASREKDIIKIRLLLDQTKIEMRALMKILKRHRLENKFNHTCRGKR